MVVANDTFVPKVSMISIRKQTNLPSARSLRRSSRRYGVQGTWSKVTWCFKKFMFTSISRARFPHDFFPTRLLRDSAAHITRQIMATTRSLSRQVDVADDDDDDDELSEEQIQSLLNGATARLEAKSQLSLSSNSLPRLTFPKLDAGTTAEPVLVTENKLTRINKGVEQGEASGFRKVEDPVVAKAFAKEVCCTSLSFFKG